MRSAIGPRGAAFHLAGERQRHDERGAFSDALALRDNRATVHLHHVLHDRKPEAEPHVIARAGAVGLAEAVEHIRQELAGEIPSPVSVIDTHALSAVLSSVTLTCPPAE